MSEKQKAKSRIADMVDGKNPKLLPEAEKELRSVITSASVSLVGEYGLDGAWDRIEVPWEEIHRVCIKHTDLRLILLALRTLLLVYAKIAVEEGFVRKVQ